MKVLVATRRTQGERLNDFCWAVDGELVRFLHMVCSRDMVDPDNGCGCGRSWAGLSSHRAVTTAEVAELDISREDVVTALASHLQQGGWTPRELPDRWRDDICAEVDELLCLAASYPVGTVLVRRLDHIIPR